MTDDAWLSLVRVARDTGDVSSLFPPGVTSLADAPYTFVQTVRMTLYFLSFENLMYEWERPPKKIWLNEERMDAHWEEVKRRRKALAKGEEGEDDGGPVENMALREVFTGKAFRG